MTDEAMSPLRRRMIEDMTIRKLRRRPNMTTCKGSRTSRRSLVDHLRLGRWQERFAEEGVDGLLRDKARPSRVAPLGQEVIGTRAYRGLTGERQYPPLAVQFTGDDPPCVSRHAGCPAWVRSSAPALRSRSGTVRLPPSAPRAGTCPPAIVAARAAPATL